MQLSIIRPLHAEQRARLASPVGKRIPAGGSATRILIVDQDRKIGVTLSFMLAARSFDDVRSVRSANRAVAVAEQFHPEIVFLDLELPENGGISVARQLARNARHHRPRLIALTEHAEHPMREEARAAGFERFLVKPISSEELDKILVLGRAAT